MMQMIGETMIPCSRYSSVIFGVSLVLSVLILISLLGIIYMHRILSCETNEERIQSLKKNIVLMCVAALALITLAGGVCIMGSADRSNMDGLKLEFNVAVKRA